MMGGMALMGVLLLLLGLLLRMLVPLALVVAGAWALVRWLMWPRPAQHAAPELAPAPEPSALNVLRERYARGEIDTDAFEDLLSRLMWVGGHRDQLMPHSSGSATLG